VLSGRGLCDELITRPEESYRLWCVVVCDLETSRIGAPYIYMNDISNLRVKVVPQYLTYLCFMTRVITLHVQDETHGNSRNGEMSSVLGLPRVCSNRLPTASGYDAKKSPQPSKPNPNDAFYARTRDPRASIARAF